MKKWSNKLKRVIKESEAGRAGIQIASFYLPDVSNGLPFFRIGTDDITKDVQFVNSIVQFHRA